MLLCEKSETREKGTESTYDCVKYAETQKVHNYFFENKLSTIGALTDVKNDPDFPN